MHLTDEQWQLIEPVISPNIPARTHLGRPPINERLVMDGILWKISHNAPWYDLPPEYPSYQTCFRRYRLWQRLGVLPTVLKLLNKDLRERGGLSFEDAYENGEISIQLSKRGWHCTFTEQYKDTWQQSTALIYLGIALKKARLRRTLIIE